jgi:phage shock protein C
MMPGQPPLISHQQPMISNRPAENNQPGIRIYRSESNRMLAGVCGGLANYLGIDVTLVRLFFVLFTLAVGSGVLLYIILAIVIPSEGQAAPGTLNTAGRTGNNQGAVTIGAALLILGVFFLIQTTLSVWLPWLEFGRLWPFLLILAGGALLWTRSKGGLR